MLLNSRYAKRVFEENSFLVGTEDVMSTIDATHLFGKDAVTYAICRQAEGIETSILYDAGSGYEHIYLTFAGVQQAITYLNRQAICRQDKEKGLSGKPKFKDAEWHEAPDRTVIDFGKAKARRMA